MEFDSLLQRVAAFGSARRRLERGEVLFRQGDVGDDFYIVVSGRLRVIYGLGLEGERIVGEIGRGEPVGETAVLGGGERAATVIAIRHSELVHIPRAAYEHLLAEHPDELIELMRVIALRLKRSYESGPAQTMPAFIAIVPSNRAAPLEAFCQCFVEAIAGAMPGRSYSHLAARDLPGDLAAGVEPGRVARWLEEQASFTATIVLEADYDLTPWTRRCLRHADLVLVLGKAGSDPAPGPVELALDDYSVPVARPRIDLVLLQEAAPYSGTEAWLKPRSVTRHYHARLGAVEDCERLGRLLGGDEISVALGGGGARGLAHLGFLRACDEVGLPIDRIGGTSIGALIGGWVATGAGWREIVKEMRAGFSSHSMRGRTIPVVSVDTGQRYIRAVEAMFGDRMIEDLPINYFCVSCNLSRAEVVVHRSGSLATWVLASMSVPGVAPPYVRDGELLVDGGVLNNLPTDIARADGGGRVIGVDVSPEVDLMLPADYNGRPGNWEVLCSRLPGRPSFPGLLAVLNRVSSLSSTANIESNRKRADLLVRMPVSGYKMFEWEKIDELIELGYDTAIEKLRPLTGRPAG